MLNTHQDNTEFPLQVTSELNKLKYKAGSHEAGSRHGGGLYVF